MRSLSLQTRFLLAGGVLVLITVAGGVWSVVTLASLSAEVGQAFRRSQETVDLTVALENTLEREDDALLLALNGKVRIARSQVAQRRQDFDESYTRLLAGLGSTEELETAQALREHTDAYRRAGDDLLRQASQPGSQQIYQERVNPALRKVVPDFGRIRDLNFQAMQQVGDQARTEARRAAGIVAGIALIALGLSTVVMVRLAQGILRPTRELMRSVEAIGRDDFKSRVNVDSQDELGQLAQAFNRMAETLGEYRESSLGELLLAKSTLESTMAALPDAVIVVDPDGQIVSKNPLAASVLRAIGGEKAERFGELPLPASVLQEVDRALRDGHASAARPDLGHAISTRLDGRELKMLPTVVPIPEFAPHRPGAAVVLADVTQFVRLDELRGELVAIASHELKTPLTSLQMNLMLLQEKADNLSPRQREILTTATLGSEELAATIDELLDLTRIESGQLRLAQERVDLAAVIEQTLDKLRPRYEDAAVRLRLVKDVATAFVRGDAARLKIVFVNLLTNALKYTPRGGEVVVRIMSLQNALGHGKSSLQITVTDTGPGIPPELRERVFDKFFRVEDERADTPKGVRGTGIGLYLAREIIKAHGGMIQCIVGEDGHGTQIAIALPLD